MDNIDVALNKLKHIESDYAGWEASRDEMRGVLVEFLLVAERETVKPVKCSSCALFQARYLATPDRYDGVCRALPPTVHGWPMTTGNDWCGQYRKRV